MSMLIIFIYLITYNFRDLDLEIIRENQTEVSTYSKYCRSNRVTNNINLLERSARNKAKMVVINEVKGEIEEQSFWSKVNNIFNPFKCDNK